MSTNQSRLYNLVVTSIFSAISSLLMVFSFSLPFAPNFIKLDFSELPALIVAFAIGPWYGILVELIKNIIHMIFFSGFFVGNLANFIIGSSFVFTAGFIYKYKKTQKMALLSMLIATITMSVWGMLTNYFLFIPLYTLMFPIDYILEMFYNVNSNINSLFDVMLFTILPFNLLKGFLVSIITFCLYKKISPIINKPFKH